MRYTLFLTALMISTGSHAAHGQLQRITKPIGDSITKALAKNGLTMDDARPFHVKVVVTEPQNSQSPYQGTIEEWWTSPTEWRREVTELSGMRQTIVVVANGRKTELDEGDYFPLWLRHFVTALFDPIPNAAAWTASGGFIEQTVLPNGQKSVPCVRAKSRAGSGERATATFSNVCFDDKGRLEFVGSPSYSMEFHDYRGFGNKQIARKLVENPEPGTELVGDVTVLEDMAKVTDPSKLFTPLNANDDRFKSVSVAPETMEQLSNQNPDIAWPPVRSGNVKGHLAVYVSVDSKGRVREAWPLYSDNAGLEDPARKQIRGWTMKVATDETGKPVQVDGTLGFAFDTKIEDPIPMLTVQEMVKQTISCTPTPIPRGVAPPGTVVTIRASVDESGNTVDAEPGGGQIVWPRIWDSLRSVRSCKFKPYSVNGKATQYRGEVELIAP